MGNYCKIGIFHKNRGIKILVVEDEYIIRKGMINTIDWLSMDCKIIGEGINGREGLKLIEEFAPDLVITDIRMPVMDGLEMLKTAEEAGLKFEKIILTSYGEFKYAQEGIKLGVADYILKPIDEELLEKAVKKVKEKIEKENTLRDVENITKTKEDIEFFSPRIYLGKDSDKNRYVEKTLEKILNCYSEKLNIKDIADELDISVSYLSRKIKDVTGETFLDILNKYRVQKSLRLLLTKEYKIYEVSDMVGFTDYKHFCNVFKKYLDTAPGDFVKQNIIILK